MITALAQYIAGCLLRNNIIDGEKLDIYPIQRRNRYEEKVCKYSGNHVLFKLTYR